MGVRLVVRSGWPMRVATSIFFYGLSLNLLLAIVAVFRFLGVEYSIGYTIHVADAMLFSSQVDPIMWLLVTVATAVTALLLAGGVGGKEGFGWGLYSLVAFVEVGLYANEQTVLAYWISLLFGLSFLVTTLMLARQFETRIAYNGVFMTLVGFLAALVVVESIALISRAVGWFPNLQPPEILLNTQALQDELSGFLFSYSTILMLSAILVWIAALPLIFRASQYRAVLVQEKEHHAHEARLISLILLGLSFVLAVIVPLVPYVSSSQLRGVDALFYYERLSSTSSFGEAIAQLGVEPREPYILLLYIVHRLTGWDAFRVTIFGPVLLGTSLALAAYLLTKELTKDWLAPGVAAFLSSSSLHTAVGLFAGIYANWLAMSIAMLFLYFLEKSLAKPSGALIVLTTLTSYVAAFLHAWTWGIMLTTVFVALVLMSPELFTKKTDRLRNFIRTRGPVLFSASSPLILVIITEMVGVFPGLKGAISSGLNDVIGNMSLTRLDSVFQTLSFTLHWYVGSLLAYPPLLLLAAVGGISIALSELRTPRLLVAWLLTTSFSAVLLDSYFQWRVLYIIPFELLASVGISSILSAADWATRTYGSGSSRLMLTLKLLLVAVILIDSLNYVLRADLVLPMAVQS